MESSNRKDVAHVWSGSENIQGQGEVSLPDHCDRVLSFRAQQRLLPVDEVIFWWGEIILFLYMMSTELVELNWSETERERERDVDTQLSHHPWLAVEFTTIHNIPAWKVIELYLEPSKEQHKKRTI